MNSAKDKVVVSTFKSKVLSAERGIKRNIKSENETEIDETERQSNKDCESEEEKTEVKSNFAKKKKLNNVKEKKSKTCNNSTYDPTKLEDNVSQVQERFKRGCECQDVECFEGLNPEAVYKHRLNIAELTKAEHDMYLMGLIRSCLTNPYETAKHTERQRLRAKYVYQGRRVCLDAFLYLENCTHYQVKRLRKHLTMHGVTPRVHGNHGKVPHNTFSLDIYQIATEFLKNFIKKQELKQKTKVSNNSPLYLPPDITRKTVHDMYKEYCKNFSPDIKILGYSTFRTFLKVQFPQLRFAKLEFAVRTQNVQNQNNTKVDAVKAERTDTILQSTQILNENGDLVPIIIANNPLNETQTYIITPDNELQRNINYEVTQNKILISESGESLTIANISTL